jgi:FkbM family methyltransferase
VIAAMNSGIKKIVSVCALKDLRTWLHASRHVKQRIQAERYEVIVPSAAVQIFAALSEPGWQVCDEASLATEFSLEHVQSKMPAANRARAGWYFQQLLKIKALSESDQEVDLMLIWDADTIPLRRLDFTAGDRVAYFKGSEHHVPYFEAMQRLIQQGRQVDFSFIAQCFAARVAWVKEFIAYVEARHRKPWYDAILDNSDLSLQSGFSEYETLGNFFYARHRDEMHILSDRWERSGEKVAPLGESDRRSAKADDPAFVSYESWAEQPLRRPAHSLKRPASEEQFLSRFFGKRLTPRTVIQVGANDGVMCDPLRPFFAKRRNDSVRAILVEPLDFYFKRLQQLYAGRRNTILIKGAAGERDESREFFHIDPAVASEMNGDGPQNDWAHGQGSFHRESVLHWIDQNSFRGQHYRENIDRYKQAILKTQVTCFPLRNIYSGRPGLTLLTIDVQGAELDVLLGVDWRRPPDFIIYEQDLARLSIIDEMLRSLGYEYLCGDPNVVYYNPETVALR